MCFLQCHCHSIIIFIIVNKLLLFLFMRGGWRDGIMNNRVPVDGFCDGWFVALFSTFFETSFVCFFGCDFVLQLMLLLLWCASAKMLQINYKIGWETCGLAVADAISDIFISIGTRWSYNVGACKIIPAVPTTTAIVNNHKNKRSSTIATYFQSSFTCFEVFVPIFV